MLNRLRQAMREFPLPEWRVKMISLAYRVGRILLGLLGLAAIVYTWLWTAIG